MSLRRPDNVASADRPLPDTPSRSHLAEQASACRPVWLTSLHRFSEPFRDISGVRRPAVFPVVSRRFRPGLSHETLHFLEPFPAARHVTRDFSVPLRDMTSRVRKCHRL